MKSLSALLFAFLPLVAVADVIVPAASVENYVNIRKAPDAASEVVGRLGQGDAFELVSAPDGWYEVRLGDELTGFVSADWAEVRAGDDVAEVEDVADEVAEEVAEELTQEVDEEISADVAGDVDAAVETDITDVIAEEEVAVESGESAEAIVIEESEEPETVETLPVPVAEVPAAVEPPPPAAAANLEGDVNFLVKFRRETQGGNSQIFDDGNRVGIGTTEPEQRLDVNGSVQIHDRNSSLAGLIITQSAGDSGYIMHNRAGTLTIGAGSQDRITIDRDGNVGIAVSKPEHPLEMASGAHVTAGGVWTNRSSRASKQNIARLSEADAAQALMQLEPVTFSYINETGEDYVGFIAEDVPELVANSDRSSLSTMDIVAVLTKVVQAQQRKIEELEARLEAR
jgi:hypothetical protein